MSSSTGLQVFSRSSFMVPKLLAFTKMYAGVLLTYLCVFLLKVFLPLWDITSIVCYISCRPISDVSSDLTVEVGASSFALHKVSRIWFVSSFN